MSTRSPAVASYRSVIRAEWPLALLLAVAAFVFLGPGHDILGGALSVKLGVAFAVLLGTIICGAFRVVHHAEAIAERLGEPLGTLVLTLAVIGIEVALVVATMMGGHAEAGTARDTMFAVVMLAINLVFGFSLVSGGARFGNAVHNASGSTTYLAVLVVLGGLSMVFPRMTTSAPGGYPSALQAWFLLGVSLFGYIMFLSMQMGQGRDWFQEASGAAAPAHGHGARADSLASRMVLLLVYLGAIILLAESMAHGLEGVIEGAGLPSALAGVAIAAVILAPEGFAAIQAAEAKHGQRVVNLTLGSALSTIGLTVPAVLAVSFFKGVPVELGLEATEILLLALTFLLSTITLCTGRATYVHGIMHLALFLAYLVLIFDT